MKLTIAWGAPSAGVAKRIKAILTKYQALTRPPPLSAHSARRASHDRNRLRQYSGVTLARQARSRAAQNSALSPQLSCFQR
eukprot:scaffold13178_cov119-Isochrysis_galbana.AAC.1